MAKWLVLSMLFVPCLSYSGGSHTGRLAKRLNLLHSAGVDDLEKVKSLLPKASRGTYRIVLHIAAMEDAMETVSYLIDEHIQNYDQFDFKRSLTTAAEFDAPRVVHFLLHEAGIEWSPDDILHSLSWSSTGGNRHTLTRTLLEAWLTERGVDVKQKEVHFSPATDEKLVDVPWVVFDFETTGLSHEKNEIIEIGAIKYINNKEVARFSQLIQPKGDLPARITKITGLKTEDLEGQPSLSEVMGSFMQFIGGSVLFAHNASFDSRFLRAACEEHNYDLSLPIFCTLKMARLLLKDLSTHKLVALAEHYGLKFDVQHRALDDAAMTAQILGRMVDLKTITLDDLQEYK